LKYYLIKRGDIRLSLLKNLAIKMKLLITKSEKGLAAMLSLFTKYGGEIEI
jgi:hypothetical protein